MFEIFPYKPYGFEDKKDSHQKDFQCVARSAGVSITNQVKVYYSKDIVHLEYKASDRRMRAIAEVMLTGHEEKNPRYVNGGVYLSMGLHSQIMSQSFRHSDDVSCLREKQGLRCCYLQRYIFDKYGNYRFLENYYSGLCSPTENQMVLSAFLHELFKKGAEQTQGITSHDPLSVGHSVLFEDGGYYLNGEPEEKSLNDLVLAFEF